MILVGVLVQRIFCESCVLHTKDKNCSCVAGTNLRDHKLVPATQLADFWFLFQFKFHKYWSTSANCLKSFFSICGPFHTTDTLPLWFNSCMSHKMIPAWFIRTSVKPEKVWRTKLPCYVSQKLRNSALEIENPCSSSKTSTSDSLLQRHSKESSSRWTKGSVHKYMLFGWELIKKIWPLLKSSPISIQPTLFPHFPPANIILKSAQTAALARLQSLCSLNFSKFYRDVMETFFT